jgi:hypothetical protein
VEVTHSDDTLLDVPAESFMLRREAMSCTQAALIWRQKYTTAPLAYLERRGLGDVKCITAGPCTCRPLDFERSHLYGAAAPEEQAAVQNAAAPTPAILYGGLSVRMAGCAVPQGAAEPPHCQPGRQAVVVAIGVRETGEREVIGFALGTAESEAFWLEFLRRLVARGLHGVLLVTSDSHEGLKAAIAKVITGPTWQRCRVHFMRNLLAHIPNGENTLVAALVRTIFVQPHRPAAGQQVAETLRLMRER